MGLRVSSLLDKPDNSSFPHHDALYISIETPSDIRPVLPFMESEGGISVLGPTASRCQESCPWTRTAIRPMSLLSTTESIVSLHFLRHSKLLGLQCIRMERGVLLGNPDCGRTTTTSPCHHVHHTHLRLDTFAKPIDQRLTFSLTLPKLSPSSTQTVKSPP